MGQKKLKILIIEDELDICSALTSFLEKRAHDVSSTDSGLKGLLKVKAFKPDLVILDLTLKDINGLEFLRRLRVFDEKTKVAVITGTIVSQKEKDEFFTLGIRGYYNKPVSLEKIESLIVKVAEGSEKIFFDAGDTSLASKDKDYSKESSKTFHKMLNAVSIMRHQCEHFVLDFQDGLYKGKKDAQILQKAIDVMKNTVKNADKAASIIHQISDRLNKE